MEFPYFTHIILMQNQDTQVWGKKNYGTCESQVFVPLDKTMLDTET